MPTAYHLRMLYHEGAGFFSLVNKLLTYVKMYQPVYKISFEVNTPLNTYGKGEIFRKLFYDTTNPTYESYTIEDIDCWMFPDETYTGHTAAKLYTEQSCIENNLPPTWRTDMNILWNTYLKIHNQEVLERFEEFKETLEMVTQGGKKRVITMLARHLDHGKEQPNKKLPGFEQYDEEILKIESDLEKLVIVCLTDSTEAYEYFKEKYKNYTIVFPPVERQRANELQVGYTCDGSDERIYTAMLSVLYLTLGEYFLHPASNMATAVMYINTQIKNVYIVGV
jgi:hypothetical protein